ncbi:hypothetical protein TRVA0_005S02300 [Trichomonascus vanleenenianus]|uniref:uncharacterized protein n=1 Tax=Trichomonascus vanleenenianus TaxID=2268995 RepID=UPI003ECA9E49
MIDDINMLEILQCPTKLFDKYSESKMGVEKKRVVILGCSFTSIAVLKGLRNVQKEVSVTLVCPSTHFYFCIGAPKVISDSAFLEAAFEPVETILKTTLPQGDTSFVQGAATKADFDKKTVSVSDGSTISYDILVIGTGSRSSSRLLKLDGSYNESVAEFEQVYAALKTAKSVAVVGGGAAGVEVAAELKKDHPNLDVTLYHSRDLPLPVMPMSQRKAANDILHKMGITVVGNMRLTSSERVGDQTKLVFKDGTISTVDLYIPTLGSIPNSEFLDPAVLDVKRHVKVNEHLQVGGFDNVYAGGDVISNPISSGSDIFHYQSAVIAQGIAKIVTGKGSFGSYSRPQRQSMHVTIGSSGVAVALGWSIPGFVLRMLGSDDYKLTSYRKQLL